MSATTRRPIASPVSARRTTTMVAPAALVLAMGGMAVSAYLTIEHYTAPTTLACPDTGVVNCQKVTSSPQSHIFGIPVAVLGLVFFAAMTALDLPRLWRTASRPLHLARVAAATIGVVMVLYLLGVELFIVDAICLWCTAVHALTFSLFAVVALGAALTPAAAAGPARR